MLNRKAILSAGLLLLSAFILPLSGCESSAQKEPPAKEQPKAVLVETVKVVPGSMMDVLVLPGETLPDEHVKLPAEVDGRVEWVGPKEGQTVKKGELIAKIDVSSLKAALDKAEAAFRLARDQLKRRASLAKRRVLPQEDLEKAETEQTVAQGNLRLAKVAYDKGFVRSPIDGVVNIRYVDPGEWAAAGKPVADIVNVKVIRVHANVPELDVRYLKTGQKARVTIDAYPKRVWWGTITFVSMQADAATKTFMVRVEVQNPDNAIRPGMIGRVAFLKRTIPDALSIPLSAIVDKGGERLVFVEKDGVAHARQVRVGVILLDRIQITKGLAAGDNLIVKGQHMVEEGIKVSVK